jgi:hypothetical protein
LEGLLQDTVRHMGDIPHLFISSHKEFIPSPNNLEFIHILFYFYQLQIKDISKGETHVTVEYFSQFLNLNNAIFKPKKVRKGEGWEGFCDDFLFDANIIPGSDNSLFLLPMYSF